MFRKILAGVVLIVGISGIAGSAFGFTLFGDSGSPGVFCKVDDPDVCVITQNEEDCKKLGGEKADSCEAPKDTEGKE